MALPQPTSALRQLSIGRDQEHHAYVHNEAELALTPVTVAEPCLRMVWPARREDEPQALH